MGKNFLITGGARGIGRGLSRQLLAKGHRVFLLDNNEVELEHLRAHLPKLCPDTDSSAWHIMLGDLRKPSDISNAARKASAFFNGKLDCLINNAFSGPVGMTPFADLDLEDWNRILQTNLTGTMLMTQACLPLLRRKRQSNDAGVETYSSVINMSSTRAKQSEPNSEGYATTKAGLIGMTQALSCSLAANDEFYAVSVNTILPGWINVQNECKDADLNGTSWEAGLSKDDHRWHWTGRVGKADDILKAVEYLVDSGGFVTGQEIVVDGVVRIFVDCQTRANFFPAIYCSPVPHFRHIPIHHASSASRAWIDFPAWSSEPEWNHPGKWPYWTNDEEWIREAAIWFDPDLKYEKGNDFNLARIHNIDGLGPLLRYNDGDIERYLCRDFSGIYYFVDLSVSSPLIFAFIDELTEAEMIREVLDGLYLSSLLEELKLVSVWSTAYMRLKARRAVAVQHMELEEAEADEPNEKEGESDKEKGMNWAEGKEEAGEVNNERGGVTQTEHRKARSLSESSWVFC